MIAFIVVQVKRGPSAMIRLSNLSNCVGADPDFEQTSLRNYKSVSRVMLDPSTFRVSAAATVSALLCMP